MLTIGFATEFYTLWDVENQPTYFTDSYGSTHKTGVKTICSYIKNVSTDLDKVKMLHPDLIIDENLRGKSSSFSFTKEEDLTPHILKFGKYSGKTIQDVSEIDFSYILWLIKECSNAETRKLCKELSLTVAHFEKIASEQKALQDSVPLIQSGEVEVLFNSNPNKLGMDLGFIQNNAQVIGELPTTLVWESVNEQVSTNKDWFLIEKAMGKSGLYRIARYRDNATFHINDENFDTIEEARKHAEVQELVNAHDLEKHMIDTKFAPLKKMHYAVASVGEGNTVLVFFNNVKEVNGMYPYNMGVINGKAMKLKGKTIKLNLTVLHTEMYSASACQYAIINN